MIEYFSTHKTAANLMMMFFMVIGFTSLSKLQMETLPQADLKYVQIKVTYPGASAKDVEDGVCRKIEDAIDKVSNIEELMCESREGVGIARVEIIEAQNWSDFLDDIKMEVDTIDNFPSQVDKITISELNKQEQVIDLVLYSDTKELNLKDYANQIKDELQAIDGISLVDILGVSKHEFRVSLPLINLEKYGLSITDIYNRLKSQNLNIPSGVIEGEKKEYLIKFENEKKNIKDLKDIIIINSKGAEVSLDQIAKIEERFKLDEEKIIFNGKRALVLKIRKTRSEDTVKIADKIKEYIKTKQFPSSIKTQLINDFSALTLDRLRLLIENAIQGLILVFLALWLFFRIRFAFWVTMGLPVSFLGGLWLMSLFGVSINMLSMVALLIAIGILMDDAIVISENIAAKYQQTKDIVKSVVLGVDEVKSGVLSSFFTTCAVFIPLSFLSGDIGQILKVVPVVLIMVLVVSLVEAFFILPNHLSHSLEGIDKKDESFRAKFNQKIENFKEDILAKALKKVLEYRYLFIGCVIGVFILSIGILAGGILKFQAFPDLEGDFVEARILLHQGTPLDETKKVIDKILDRAKQIDSEYKKEYGINLLKNYAIYYNKNLDSYEKGKHIATISLELLTSNDRNMMMNDFISKWKISGENIPNATLISFKEPALPVGGLPIEIKLFSNDLDELEKSSHELKDWIRKYRGIFYVSSDLRKGKKEYSINLKDGTLLLGITSKMVADELRGALYGFEVNEFQLDKELIELNVKFDDNKRLQDIKNLRVKGVPLSEIINIKETKSYSRINRIDKKRVVTIQGEIDTRVTNANEILSHTQKNFFPLLKEKYPNVDIKIYGQAKETKKTGKSFLSSFLIGIFLIFLLLSLQFKSYIEPFIAISIIPLAFIGVIWGHLLMGINLAMPSMSGFVSLGGIVINNSILLVLFLKSNIDKLGLDKALIKASKDRFRAISLTSITTIAGLIPLLLETSLQAQILIPLIVSIIFGLLISTVLVLFVVPVLYKIVDDFRSNLT